MGKRGPKPKDSVAPTLLPGVPVAPDRLGEVGREHWAEVASLLHEAGILSKVDRDVLESYCAYFEDEQGAAAEVKAAGRFITAPNGYRQENPAYTAQQRARDKRVKMMDGLGLTPAGRSRLAIKAEEEIPEQWREFEAARNAD